MSVEIDIIPTRNTTVSVSGLLGRLSSSYQGVRILKLGCTDFASPVDALEIDSEYEIRFEDPSHVLVYAWKIDEDDTEYEAEYLVEYGRNLEAIEQKRIEKAWRPLGYYFKISSARGRTASEVALQQLIAGEIGMKVDGVIAVKEENLFNAPIGLYRPDVFSRFTPLF